MMPHCKRDEQFELFEAHAPKAEHAPKIALPFQRSAEIDAQRAKKIFGVAIRTLYRMLDDGLIRGYRYGSWRIEYQSVVDYCDQLCVRYGIQRKSARPASGRFRDRDLLPFPLDETTDVGKVAERLDCSISHVIALIDEGRFTAYRIREDRHGAPWRIHEESVERYIASLHARVTQRKKRD